MGEDSVNVCMRCCMSNVGKWTVTFSVGIQHRETNQQWTLAGQCLLVI